MDPVSTASQSSALRSGAPQPSAPKEKSKTADADFDTFLQLLTAQLRNQDPLKPLDSTQFVSQLASFSTVEQQVETNDKLDSLAKALGGDDVGSMARLVGLDVEAPGAPASFTGDAVSFALPGMEDADRGVVTMRDANGDAVASFPVGGGAEAYKWSGALPDGGVAPQGLYTAEATYYTGDSPLATRAAAAYGRVTEIRLGGEAEGASEPQAYFAGGAMAPVSSITGVRSPSAS